MPFSRRAAHLRSAGGARSSTNTPAVSNVQVIRISDTSVIVAWTVSPNSTGQVRYGTTTSYGSQTSVESSFLGYHAQTVSGLTPSTLYHFSISCQNQYGETYNTDDQTFTTTSSAFGVYGPAFNMDTKDNLQVGTSSNYKWSYRFTATQSSAANSVTWIVRRGVGYHAGTGGQFRISIQSDDGTGNHYPSGTMLGQKTYSPGATPTSSWYVRTTFTSAPTLVAGTIYHVVFENIDANPTANYCSVNNTYMWSAYNGGAPFNLDGVMATLRYSGGAWGVRSQDFPAFDVTYANGSHDGSAYVEAMLAQTRVLTGTNSKVRERFTPTSAVTIKELWVRVGRQSGTGVITARLQKADGTLVETGTIAASSVVAYTPGAETRVGDWVGYTFGTPVSLQNGQEYHLILSTDGASQYSMTPIRVNDPGAVGDPAFASRGFFEGVFEYTTNNSTWSKAYAFDTYGPNMQFYFVT